MSQESRVNAAMRYNALHRRLKLVPGECLDRIVERALPILDAIDERRGPTLLKYYGLKDHKITSAAELAKELGARENAVKALVDRSVIVLQEISRTMRQERLRPNAYPTWPVVDFFTTERGVLAKLDKNVTGHVREIFIRQQRHIPTVADVCEKTERQVSCIPFMGPRIRHGVIAMLATADLSLAE